MLRLRTIAQSGDDLAPQRRNVEGDEQGAEGDHPEAKDRQDAECPGDEQHKSEEAADAGRELLVCPLGDSVNQGAERSFAGAALAAHSTPFSHAIARYRWRDRYGIAQADGPEIRSETLNRVVRLRRGCRGLRGVARSADGRDASRRDDRCTRLDTSELDLRAFGLHELLNFLHALVPDVHHEEDLALSLDRILELVQP